MRHVTITKLATPPRVKLPGERRYSTPLMTVIDDAGVTVAGVTEVGIDSTLHMPLYTKGQQTRVTLGFEDGSDEVVMATYINEKVDNA